MTIQNGIATYKEHEWDELMLDFKKQVIKDNLKNNVVVSKEKNKIVLIKEKK